MSAAVNNRFQSEGFILHTYPYKETSLIVEAFTLKSGRISMVAKGAKRPHSKLRSALNLFQIFEIEWAGRNELKNLYRVDWLGGIPPLVGMPLVCGFYLNELIMYLLAKDDPHERLFKIYANTIRNLGEGLDISPILRKFEVNLLKELGYEIKLDKDGRNNYDIIEKDMYTYLPEIGPVKLAKNSENQLKFHGKTLRDIQNENFCNRRTLVETKKLTRYLLDYYLGEKKINTRSLLKVL